MQGSSAFPESLLVMFAFVVYERLSSRPSAPVSAVPAATLSRLQESLPLAQLTFSPRVEGWSYIFLFTNPSWVSSEQRQMATRVSDCQGSSCPGQEALADPRGRQEAAKPPPSVRTPNIIF